MRTFTNPLFNQSDNEIIPTVNKSPQSPPKHTNLTKSQEITVKAIPEEIAGEITVKKIPESTENSKKEQEEGEKEEKEQREEGKRENKEEEEGSKENDPFSSLSKQELIEMVLFLEFQSQKKDEHIKKYEILVKDLLKQIESLSPSGPMEPMLSLSQFRTPSFTSSNLDSMDDSFQPLSDDPLVDNSQKSLNSARRGSGSEIVDRNSSDVSAEKRNSQFKRNSDSNLNEVTKSSEWLPQVAATCAMKDQLILMGTKVRSFLLPLYPLSFLSSSLSFFSFFQILLLFFLPPFSFLSLLSLFSFFIPGSPSLLYFPSFLFCASLFFNSFHNLFLPYFFSIPSSAPPRPSFLHSPLFISLFHSSSLLFDCPFPKPKNRNELFLHI